MADTYRQKKPSIAEGFRIVVDTLNGETPPAPKLEKVKTASGPRDERLEADLARARARNAAKRAARTNPSQAGMPAAPNRDR